MNDLAGIYARGAQDWQDALLAVSLSRIMATGRHLPGFLVRGGSAAAREAWLSELQTVFYPLPFKSLPSSASVSDLTGQLDIGDTLASGRASWKSGLLENAGNGYLVVHGGERIRPEVLHPVLDQVSKGRIGLVVFLEEAGKERDANGRLADHLDFHLDLSLVNGMTLEEAELPAIGTNCIRADFLPEVVDTLCKAALQLGLTSLRPPRQALGIAVAHARMVGNVSVSQEDIAAALRLSLLNRALAFPAELEEAVSREPQTRTDAKNSESGAEDSQSAAQTQPPQDIDVAIEGVRLPEGLVARLIANITKKAISGGTVPGGKHGSERGRPRPSRKGMPGRDGRADIHATLLSAAPWQTLRKKAMPDRTGIRILPRDLYVKRYRQEVETLTIFVVDASGSTALNRLGEAKGAVETLLAESYRTRAHVALVSVRRERAELALPPTRSLTRAKRCLANLQGGGGTPLADGLRLAASLADEQFRLGRNVSIVLLTDGSANIALDGTADRKQATEDALNFARSIKDQPNSVVLLDVGRAKTPKTENLAVALGARHVPMPFSSTRNIIAGIGSQ